MLRLSLTITLFFFFLFSFMVFGQRQNPILKDNSDIKRVITNIKQLEGFADECSELHCPKIDCAYAEDVYVRIRDAREYLRHFVFWLDRATDITLDHVVAMAEQRQLTYDRIQRLQNLAAYQEIIMNCASTAINLSSATLNLKGAWENIQESNILYPDKLQVLQDLDLVYEALTAFDVTRVKIMQTYGWDDADEFYEYLTNDDIANFKSLFSNVKNILIQVRKNRNLTESILEGQTGNILSLLGQIASYFGDESVKKRKKRIKELMADPDYWDDSVVNGVLEEFEILRERKKQANDAYKRLNRLIIGAAPGNITNCFMRMKHVCQSLNLDYLSDADIEEKYRTYDYFLDDAPKRHYAEALFYFNDKLPHVEQLLKEVPVISDYSPPSLTTDRTIFKPKERIDVRFTAPPCYPHRSWAGLVPSTVKHGSETLNNEKHVGSLSYLQKKESGNLIFIAPDEPGKYDIRMNDIETKAEVKSLTIEVVDALGFVSMKAIDENDQPLEYFVRIKKDGEHVKSAAGVDLKETLAIGSYKLLFLVDDKDFVRNVTITEDNIAEVVIRLGEKDDDKEDPPPLDDDPNDNDDAKLPFDQAKTWIGEWISSIGDLDITYTNGQLNIVCHGSLGITIYIMSATADKITGEYTTRIDTRGEFSIELYKTPPDVSGRQIHFRGLRSNNVGEPLTRPWNGHKNR